jgi:hypothetical protein
MPVRGFSVSRDVLEIFGQCRMVMDQRYRLGTEESTLDRYRLSYPALDRYRANTRLYARDTPHCTGQKIWENIDLHGSIHGRSRKTASRGSVTSENAKSRKSRIGTKINIKQKVFSQL